MSPTTAKQKLIETVRRDKKKAITLGVLVAVLGGIWAIRGTSKTAGPNTAVASPVAPSNNKRGKGIMVRPALARADSRSDLQAWLQKPLSEVGRNLFVVNLDYYPQDGRQSSTLRTATGDGFWDQVQKSMTAQADQKKERQILIENLRLQAAQLKLETTMMGASPKALINGQLVGEGEVVAGFRVLKIEARRIIVEREGIKLEIRMN